MNCVSSHNDCICELNRVGNTPLHMKLAYYDIQVRHINWIAPFRHAYDNYTVSNPISDSILDSSNYLPPSIIVPKPQRQERR